MPAYTSPIFPHVTNCGDKPRESATVRLPAILGSHMVLQQKAPVNFWGWANPAEKIRIMTDWDNTVYDTTADGGGQWQVRVQTPAAGGPYKVIVNGANAIVLEDVMIGEVWVCSGQSNMEWSGDQGVPQSLEEAAGSTYSPGNSPEGLNHEFCWFLIWLNGYSARMKRVVLRFPFAPPYPCN
jgi:hypothetical protein